jgi:hypothetical protein
MNIDDAIKQLQDTKEEGVKDIVLAYWTADMFNHKEGDDWAYLASQMEGIDWSRTWDDLSAALEDFE